MEKMKELTYLEKKINQTSDFEGKVEILGLERGFGNTLGISLRRVLMSNITSIAPFCIRIEGVDHEFQTVPNVKEDVVTLILNLKKVRFTYNPEYVKDDQIIKVTILSEEGQTIITSNNLVVTNAPGVEIIDRDIHIAELAKPNALKLEMFLRPGRGQMYFDENKNFINNIEAELDSSLKNGAFIAVDSIFSPIKKVNYRVDEINSASTKIEEKLTMDITTDGSITVDDALKESCKILIAHYQFISDLIGVVKDDVFAKFSPEDEKKEEDVSLRQLQLSVRSLNALEKENITTLNQLCLLTKTDLEQIKNLGKKSFDEIIEKITDLGRTLKEGDE